jgi:hypothetical protein
MGSYFVASHAPGREPSVHERGRCPPDCFPRNGLGEYLGEFLHAGQAIAVARLRYAHAHACPSCEPLALAALVDGGALGPA